MEANTAFRQLLPVRRYPNVSECYHTLRSIPATPPISMAWISKYLPQDEIRNVYTLAARVKSKNKVREMQYKILNKYLATNVLLKKMNRKDFEICSFCAEEREDLRHLFFDCHVIKEFWMAFNV